MNKWKKKEIKRNITKRGSEEKRKIEQQMKQERERRRRGEIMSNPSATNLFLFSSSIAALLLPLWL